MYLFLFVRDFVQKDERPVFVCVSLVVHSYLPFSWGLTHLVSRKRGVSE